MIVAAASAVAGCGSGCAAKVEIEPVTVQGNGKNFVSVDLSARVTVDGEPASGVRVVFEIGWPPSGEGGTHFGSAVTDETGVARLHAPNSLGPRAAGASGAAQWTRYEAKPSIVQTTEGAGEAACAPTAKASFRFEP